MILFQRKTPRPKIELQNKQRKIWVKKSNVNCFACFTCLRTCATNSCYFDSGYFKYMTGNQSILTDYKSISIGQVTFNDRVKGSVLGKETLNMKGFPRLGSVLHVEGMKLI